MTRHTLLIHAHTSIGIESFSRIFTIILHPKKMLVKASERKDYLLPIWKTCLIRRKLKFLSISNPSRNESFNRITDEQSLLFIINNSIYFDVVYIDSISTNAYFHWPILVLCFITMASSILLFFLLENKMNSHILQYKHGKKYIFPLHINEWRSHCRNACTLNS